MSRARSDDFLWLSLALMPLIAISFLLAIQPQDYWWALRVGQDALRGGAIPLTDTISASQQNQPIIYQTWLSGVIFYIVYQLGGLPLTFLLRGILLGIAYGMIWATARAVSNPRLATVLVFILGLASGNNWAMRNQLLAYPLFALCLWILFQWQNSQNKQSLWALPIITLLWVNIHGSFVLPLILTAAALLFGKGARKPLWIVFGFMLLATLINPFGYKVWNYFFFMLNSPSDQLFAFEWMPPRNEGWQMNIFFAWTILFAPLAGISPRRLSAFEWILFLGFGWLAFTGMRYVIWFLFILTILTAALLSEWARRFDKIQNKFPIVNLVFGISMLASSLLFLHGLREKWLGDSIRVYELSTTPVAAAAWLSQRPELPGPLWTDYAFGGYLSFNLQSRKPWMDSRFNAFPPEQWAEYTQVSRAENWQAMFDREGINLLMLSQTSQPKLIQAVTESKIWCEQYRDDYAVIFVRCEK